MNVKYHWACLALVLSLWSCTAQTDPSTTPEQRWPASGVQNSVAEPVPLADRAISGAYGLPRGGQASIQDLIDILPTDNIGFDDPKFFSSAQQPLMCTNGRTSQTPE